MQRRLLFCWPLKWESITFPQSILSYTTRAGHDLETRLRRVGRLKSALSALRGISPVDSLVRPKAIRYFDSTECHHTEKRASIEIRYVTRSSRRVMMWFIIFYFHLAIMAGGAMVRYRGEARRGPCRGHQLPAGQQHPPSRRVYCSLVPRQ